MKKIFLKTYSTEEILISALRGDNNVVVTTKCNLNCVFCSRKFNPFITECSHKDFNLIKAQINLLKPNGMIAVNNSISRLTDGEPFTHPRIWDILELARKKFPYQRCLNQLLGNRIQITTNGSCLTKENLKQLEKLQGITIIHSINTTDKNEWAKLSGSNNELAEIATNVPSLIKDFDINYTPSIVALPKLVGWEGIKNTITDLNREGIKIVRMFLPTYTKYALKEEQNMLKCDKEKLHKLVLKLNKELNMSIQCYPFYLTDLTPKLKNFECYGILSTDIIHSIDDTKIFSSWHAQDLLLKQTKKVHIVNFERNGIMNTVRIQPQDIKITSHIEIRVNTDVDFLSGGIVGVVGDCGRVLVLASEAGSVVVRRAFEKAVEWEPVLRDKEFFFRTVKSRFYEGSVVCAGLLMCSDYREAIREFLEGGVRPDLILVSRKSFDPLGRDLLKESIYDLSDEFNIPIETL